MVETSGKLVRLVLGPLAIFNLGGHCALQLGGMGGGCRGNILPPILSVPAPIPSSNSLKVVFILYLHPNFSSHFVLKIAPKCNTGQRSQFVIQQKSLNCLFLNTAPIVLRYYNITNDQIKLPSIRSVITLARLKRKLHIRSTTVTTLSSLWKANSWLALLTGNDSVGHVITALMQIMNEIH